MPKEIKDNVCLIFTKNWTHIKAIDQIMSMFVIIQPFHLIFVKETFQKFLPNIIEIHDVLKEKLTFSLIYKPYTRKFPLSFKNIH